MQTYLGLGSNLGDRRENLRAAIAALEQSGVRVRRTSPVVESPALLPADASAEWNRPFLNLVADCEAGGTPEELHASIKRIESRFGRSNGERWSPRPIDIDILLWGDEQIDTDTLKIPHPHSHVRGFVLTPLIALTPQLRLPGRGEKTLLEWSDELRDRIPLWMGILNVTPDSFSDGGRHGDWNRALPQVDAMLDAGVHIVDVGAESTRPGAEPIDPDTEWRRLEPVLRALQERLGTDPLRARISVDTYHPETARKSLDCGVDIINDVSGLTNPAMIELAADGRADWVAMHSVSVPADKTRVLPPRARAFPVVDAWLQDQLENWTRAGIDPERLIFDPGIGFGKDPLQSLELLRSAGEFRRHGLRVLIGHSRKSFFQRLTDASVEERDLATLGVSLALSAQGVDILRVHDVPLHVEAYRGYSHAIAARNVD
jgi:2-amino-4-hydroxy-6-hydroxymethyldihydropteridine diphosphokinase/dihydropteroate synthase